MGPQTEQQVRRIYSVTGAAWILSALLAFTAPILRYLTTTHIPGVWPIGAAVAVMVVHLFLTDRKLATNFDFSLSMSASAICLGGATGFGVLASMQHKGLTFLIAAKWALIGVALLVWFLKRLPQSVRTIAGIPDRSRDVARTPEEMRARIEEIRASRERSMRQTKLLVAVAVLFCAAGTVLICLTVPNVLHVQAWTVWCLFGIPASVGTYYAARHVAAANAKLTDMWTRLESLHLRLMTVMESGREPRPEE